MNNKYSKKELKLIYEIPQLTVLLMVTASTEKITKNRLQLKAGTKAITDGLITFSENELIKKIVSEKDTEEEQQKIINAYYVKDLFNIEIFQNSILQKYGEVLHYINKKEIGKIVNQFKLWLLSIAEEVAVSSIENKEFNTKEQVLSKKEREIFKKIEKALTKLK